MQQQFYKNIEVAILATRPQDKIVRVINNKFAVIKNHFTSGDYSRPQVVFLREKTVYQFSPLENVKAAIENVLSWPNIHKTTWCMNHKENGKPHHYVTYTEDNRKIKQTARQLKKAFNF
jgi:hypothetical protein